MDSDKKDKVRKRGRADSEQYERFTEAAREAGCDENVGRLDEVVRHAAKLPPPRQERKGARRSKGSN
jgi:hypothetical protein